MTKTKEIKTQKKEQVSEQPSRSAKAKVKFLRIGPRKVRIVIDTIRWKQPEEAFRILMNLKNKAARMTEKILKTAVANAKVLNMDESRLYISDVRADGGPTMKRFMARSMGRADKILKRTTHLSIELKEGQKRWDKSPEAPEAQAEKKETKSGKKLFGRSKKSAASA